MGQSQQADVLQVTGRKEHQANKAKEVQAQAVQKRAGGKMIKWQQDRFGDTNNSMVSLKNVRSVLKQAIQAMCLHILVKNE